MKRRLLRRQSLLFAIGLVAVALDSLGSRVGVAAPAPKCVACTCREWEGWSLVTKVGAANPIYMENVVAMGKGQYFTTPAAVIAPFFSAPNLCDLTPGDPIELPDETVKILFYPVGDGVTVCDADPRLVQIELQAWMRGPLAQPPAIGQKKKVCAVTVNPGPQPE